MANWDAAVEELESWPPWMPLSRSAALLAKRASRGNWPGCTKRATRLCQARAWQAIPRIFEKIHAQDAAYPDAKGLLAAALGAIAAADRERKVRTLCSVHAGA